jgi:hypothetical protein
MTPESTLVGGCVVPMDQGRRLKEGPFFGLVQYVSFYPWDGWCARYRVKA